MNVRDGSNLKAGEDCVVHHELPTGESPLVHQQYYKTILTVVLST